MAVELKIFDIEYHRINADGLRVIDTKDGPYVVRTEEPKKPAYFGHKCPRTGHRCDYLIIRGGTADQGKRPSWVWNGDHDRPTLTPSINCLAHNPQDPTERYAGCGWHGYITDGAHVGQ